MQQSQSIIINFKGGIISPGYLKDIMEIASEANIQHAGFGLRQQLLMQVPVKKIKDFEKKCLQKNILFYEEERALPNIVSSYCTSKIFTVESWLSEGVYKDVFDLYDYQPVVKINICDSKQNLVPFFSGHLNWLSSEHTHYWQLSLRLPGTNDIYNWPDLVYTNDIAHVSKALEELIIEQRHSGTENNLFRLVNERINYISKPLRGNSEVPLFHLPYYEGFSKEGATNWLGIYRRNELFPVGFLIDACNICLETKIGEVYTTAWKSIIIKGIHETHRKIWDEVLGTYRINVRHAANELNWQVEDNSKDGLVLKRYLIRHFDIKDLRTQGLSFAIKTRNSPGLFGSVIINKQPGKYNSRLKSADRYEILYTRDFNPNSTEFHVFRKEVGKDQLGVYLASLCKYYYEQGSNQHLNFLIEQKNSVPDLTQTVSSAGTYQCLHCFTVYNESIGEPESNIEAGTLFVDLKIDYSCPLCEAGKESFHMVSEIR